MRFVLATTGSLGDVRPFIALAVGLAQTGHSVRLAGPMDASGLCANYGIDFYPIDGEHQTRLSRQDQPQIESGNTLRFGLQRLAAKQRIFEEVNRAAWDACQDAQVIIYRIGGFLAADCIAERLNLPCFKAGLVPYTPTQRWPSLYIYRGFDFGRVGNRLSYWVGEQLVWQFFRQSTNTFREELGLRPYGLHGADRQAYTNQLPVLYGFSPALLPRPPDWPAHAHITGHWALKDSENWQPPLELVEFLSNGPAPVYAGFGSMLNQGQDEMYELVGNAVEQCDQRAVLVGNWNKPDCTCDAAGKVFTLARAPHDWLMPRMATAIHHGGIGTTTSALKAGLACVVIPFNYDQPFWGNQIARQGLGPAPVARQKLTVERLGRALQTSLQDKEMRQRAMAVGQQIKSEDGIRKAVQLIQNYL